ESSGEVCDDVVDVLDANGQTYQSRRYTGGELLLRGELGVGGGCGVNDEAANVADVGDVAEQSDTVDQRTASVDPALELEGQHPADPLGSVDVSGGVPRARRETGVVHRGDVVVALEPFRDSLCIGDMSFDPQT